MEQAADAAAFRLDPGIADLVSRLLAITGDADAAIKDIRTLAKKPACR